ncbi:MAG: DUF6544 family protein [bacterium]
MTMRLISLVGVASLVAMAFGLAVRSTSFRREFRRAAARAIARPSANVVVTDRDLALLPSAVARYVRLAGAVGRPRVHSFHARFTGQIRSGPNAPWMPFTAEQYNFFRPAARYFIMGASRSGVPFQALHAYEGATATMRVRVASLVNVVDARGAEMDVAETVTLFNDMCVFAPAALIAAPVRWTEIDSHTVAASFTNAEHTIGATLRFSDNGELADFVSDDRSASADGRAFTRMRWSTPLSAYRDFDGYRIASRGEGRWHAAEGEYAYIRIELESITYNSR